MNFDLSPLMRLGVGFDHLDRLVLNRLRDLDNNFPPFNIEKLDEERYRISMAVAGYNKDEITVEVERNRLRVAGFPEKQDERQYLHQGIAKRAFQKYFELAEHVEVMDASYDNGMVVINLMRRVPESAKPRVVPLRSMKELPAS